MKNYSLKLTNGSNVMIDSFLDELIYTNGIMDKIISLSVDGIICKKSERYSLATGSLSTGVRRFETKYDNALFVLNGVYNFAKLVFVDHIPYIVITNGYDVLEMEDKFYLDDLLHKLEKNRVKELATNGKHFVNIF